MRIKSTRANIFEKNLTIQKWRTIKKRRWKKSLWRLLKKFQELVSTAANTTGQSKKSDFINFFTSDTNLKIQRQKRRGFKIIQARVAKLLSWAWARSAKALFFKRALRSAQLFQTGPQLSSAKNFSSSARSAQWNFSTVQLSEKFFQLSSLSLVKFSARLAQ